MATSTERTRTWQIVHPERVREYNKKSRAKLRAPCKMCGTKMPFPSPGRKYCDECQPKIRAQNLKNYRRKRLDTLAEYKMGRGCDTCGYNTCASALHFHHTEDNKEHRVWIPYGDEFDKCDMLCANCHFEIHEDTKIQENGDVY